jgi:cation diffusion facilitator CzcD-associated flavoprotein CzcO
MNEVSSRRGATCCIIGAGPSGLTTAKRLKQFGIDFDWFEASNGIGGNWYYQNPNGMSACYASLHIDTAKYSLAMEDLPVPDDWPDFPHHSDILEYLNRYVDHFDLRGDITFDTRVVSAGLGGDGIWTVKTSDGRSGRYANLLVCNGHHWDPRWPDPAYPGSFTGKQIHAHEYRTPKTPIDMAGKRILVVGAGNSSMDISSEVSQRSLDTCTFVSMRHGVWIFPKYYGGVPAGQTPPRIPRSQLRRMVEKRVLTYVGRMSDYGLPEPDHKPWQAHGTQSGEFLLRVGSGDIAVRPGIERLDGDRVVFVDGTSEQIDVIVWATGYKISFPFFDQDDFKADAANRVPKLFKKMIHPDAPNLFYMGLVQSLPTLINFAEQQSKLVAELIKGNYRLPPPAEMRRIIDRDDTYYMGHFYDSPRHTIQVEFRHYSDELQKEIARGRARAARRGGGAGVARTRQPETEVA